jgi:hypothetical protein
VRRSRHVACLFRVIATRQRRQKLPRPGAVLFPRLLRTPLPPTAHDVLARRRRRRTVMLRPPGAALPHQRLTAGEAGRADVPHDPATGSHRRVGGGTHTLRTQTAALSKKKLGRAVANMDSEGASTGPPDLGPDTATRPPGERPGAGLARRRKQFSAIPSLNSEPGGARDALKSLRY